MPNLVTESASTEKAAAVKCKNGCASAGILVNPRSFRISAGARLDRVCQTARAAGTPVHVVHGPDEIQAALASFGEDLPLRLVVIGGDGTVQAAVSALLKTSPSSIPPLLVLGGGRTNLTARDLGTHRSLARLLERALHDPDGLNHTQRQILTLEQPDQGLKLFGFFVAGALVDHIIRDCHRYRTRHRGWLRTGHPSSAWRVLQLGVLGALGRSRFRPRAMRINAGGLGSLDQSVRVFVASSLEHDRGWIDPYAARGSGPVRLTAISAQAPRFWLTLPGLLRGRLNPALRAETGYLSGRTERVVVRGLNAICVDGQEYDLDPTLDLVLDPGPAIRFLTP